jgi:hypothetical protein
LCAALGFGSVGRLATTQPFHHLTEIISFFNSKSQKTFIKSKSSLEEAKNIYVIKQRKLHFISIFSVQIEVAYFS